jgi:hypothetical protein
MLVQLNWMSGLAATMSYLQRQSTVEVELAATCH